MPRGRRSGGWNPSCGPLYGSGRSERGWAQSNQFTQWNSSFSSRAGGGSRVVRRQRRTVAVPATCAEAESGGADSSVLLDIMSIIGNRGISGNAELVPSRQRITTGRGFVRVDRSTHRSWPDIRAGAIRSVPMTVPPDPLVSGSKRLLCTLSIHHSDKNGWPAWLGVETGATSVTGRRSMITKLMLRLLFLDRLHSDPCLLAAMSRGDDDPEVDNDEPS